MQDNAAERLKTFKMRKNPQLESVTSPSDPQMNFFIAKNPKYNSASSTSASSAPSSRPTSHHKRRSSVSTRRESAEMMGVSLASLADLPTSGDADTSTLRRRALWALEGKRDDDSSPSYAGGFNKVEIPELSTDIENDTESDRKTQLYSTNNSTVKRDSLGRDRDSYGRIISQALSLKDQLHTLLEEDEEEDVPVEKLVPTHSPATSSSTTDSLPHSSANRNRLKPLTLSTSVPLVSSCGASLSRPPAPILTEIASRRRSSFSYRHSEDIKASISTSSNPMQFTRYPLPTPESTPTTSERPLSPSEQAFLFNNQASLLARISELERALSSRSRPISFVSTSSRQLSTSSVASDSQSHEMLRLIQDLKTERDDLSRDLSISQSKVEALENQIMILNRRIESERREAWISKQSEQSLKIENIRLCKELESEKLQVLRLKEDLDDVHEELESRDSLHAHRKDVSMPSSIEREEFFEEVSKENVDDDELGHYEDEELGDLSFYSDQDSISSNSCRQNNLLSPRTIFGHPVTTPSSIASISPPITPLTMPVSSHKRTSSLEQGWSFPKGARPVAKIEPPKVDRFFDCLEILESDDLTMQSPIGSFDVLNQDKFGFFSGQGKEEEDDFDLPFILPPQSLTAKDCHTMRLNAPRVDCVQLTPPVSPGLAFSPKSEVEVSKSPVTPQRTRRQPSLIPKPSPSRSESGCLYPATPTSIPRVKVSPVTPPSVNLMNGKGGLKSPTKLPQLRSGSNIIHIDSSKMGRIRK